MKPVTGLMLMALMALFLAGSHRHTIVSPGEVMAAPLKPHKVARPLPQQGPPDQNTSPHSPGAFLSGPNAGDPVDIALAYIRGNRQALGLTDDDLADIVIKDHYVSPHNGVTHIYFRQRSGGIEVFNGDININISRDGEVINLGNAFVSDLSNTLNVRGPSLSAIEAVNRAAQHLGVTITEPLVPRRSPGGPAQEVVLSDGGISLDDIPAKLMVLPQPERGGMKARLVWNLVIRLRNGVNWWNIRVDAVTGAVLSQNDWIAQESYQVFATPKEHPNDGPRNLELNPADAMASPFDWHDTNGAAGAEFTITRGNNVHAYADRNDNNAPDAIPGSQPSGGAGLIFDFPLDLTMDPGTYLTASVTNLFYWNNILHDIHYQYGFDEASGNFQQNNYGNGGLGSDPVQAEAQDGADVGNRNNAFFSAPPDGSQARMEMYVWNFTTPLRDGDLDNGIITHEYGHGVSQRLTGGPSNADCLGNAEQMGEGWSDLHALFLTADASDTGDDPRGIATYVHGEPPDGPGIRTFRYSTNLAVNPHTYDDLKLIISFPPIFPPSSHRVGEIWAAMVWEVYWNLVDDYGFDPDFYNGTGGNNLTMQLVMDGLKLQPCSPGFVDGRDAILLADQVNNGGVNQCRIWEGFARRGLGFSADQGSSADHRDGTEAFDLPPQCLTNVLADLTMTKSASPTTVQPGEPITYTLTFSNQGSGLATGVVITDQLPVTLTNAKVVSSGVTITDTGTVPMFVWQVQDLQPGQEGTLTITAQIDPLLTSGGLFTNTALISTTSVESDTLNNLAQAGVTVVAPNLILTKMVDVANPGAGEEITYTITVENVGTADAIGAVVSDTLPVSLTLAGPVTLDPPSAGTPGTPPLLAANLTITAGQTITLTFPVTVSATLSPTTVITNTAAVTSLVVTMPQTDMVTITVGLAPAGADFYLPLIVKDN